MLTQFTVRRTFYKTTVTVYVDCERREASVLVKWDRLIAKSADLAGMDLQECLTPEGCNTWLSRTRGAHGSFIETMERDRKRAMA